MATREQTSASREKSSGARQLPASTGAAKSSLGQPGCARRTTVRTQAEAAMHCSSSHASLDNSILVNS